MDRCQSKLTNSSMDSTDVQKSPEIGDGKAFNVPWALCSQDTVMGVLPPCHFVQPEAAPTNPAKWMGLRSSPEGWTMDFGKLMFWNAKEFGHLLTYDPHGQDIRVAA